ncbi:CoA pyrophosphatase [Cobetia sp. 3AK]|uniref:CoA pyrophosphatase n=1 Tax=Cobetia sp. 3AK TaxID=3040020 RepID=UPI002447FC0C|nr:CoA pyrophosphatase [Cobetia sp. 3AK]MDH2372975.1 CoA pyrophosphatase [Cobetia sp. 3AK]
MLEALRQRLQSHHPRIVSNDQPRAAVLIALIDRPEPTLLLTQRASHLSQHAGQVAFPGGKAEPEDISLLATALREAEEEVALPSGEVEIYGQLSDVISLHGMTVTPFVGRIAPDLPLHADPGEIAHIFEMPLSMLLRDERAHTDVIRVGDDTWYVPGYQVAGQLLWGLSAMMLVEMMAIGFGHTISLSSPPPPGAPLRHLPPRPHAPRA